MISKTVIAVINLDWHLKLFALFISFIAPLSAIIHVVIFLLVIDAFTSIYSQVKAEMAKYKVLSGIQRLHKGLKVIDRDKLRKTLEKMFFYVLSLITFFIFDKYILKIDPTAEYHVFTFSVTNIAAVLIGIVELTSIAANVSHITDNPIFTKIIAIFRKKAGQKFDLDDN